MQPSNNQTKERQRTYRPHCQDGGRFRSGRKESTANFTYACPSLQYIDIHDVCPFTCVCRRDVTILITAFS